MGGCDAVLASPRASFAPGVASSQVRRRPRRQGRHRKRRVVTSRKSVRPDDGPPGRRRRRRRRRRLSTSSPPSSASAAPRTCTATACTSRGRSRETANANDDSAPSSASIPFVQRRRAVRTVGRAPRRHGRRVLEQRLRQRALLPPRMREAGRAAAAVAAAADDAGPVTRGASRSIRRRRRVAPGADAETRERRGNERRIDHRLGGGIRDAWTFGEDGAVASLREFLNDGSLERFDAKSARTYSEHGGGSIGGDINGNGQSNALKASTERFRADVRTTARISPYVRHGELSPREVYHSAKAVQVGSRRSRAGQPPFFCGGWRGAISRTGRCGVSRACATSRFGRSTRRSGGRCRGIRRVAATPSRGRWR